MWKCGCWTKVVIHVQNVGQQRLGRVFLEMDLKVSFRKSGRSLNILTLNLTLQGGGVSFHTAGPISTAVMWKLSLGKLQFRRTWNTIQKVTF